MSAARANPPTTLAAHALIDVTDLANGSNDFSATDALVWRLPVGRVIVRPSGTEPKLKAYLELVFEPHRDVESTYAQARALMVLLRADVNEFLRSSQS
jgi:phosphomannomutase